MAVHYIIDGYNVIKQVSFLTGKKLQHGREGLVKFIRIYKPHGSSRNDVTLVFDGKEDIVSTEALRSDIKVIFSKGESADDKIKKMVETAKNPKQIVVVSDDKAIIFYCRSAGAKALSVKEFVGNAGITKKPDKKHQPRRTEEKAGLDHNIAHKITEDLKKLWVKEGEKESWY